MDNKLSPIQNQINTDEVDPGFTISPGEEISGIINAAIGEAISNLPNTPIRLPVTIITTPTGVPCLSCSSNQWVGAGVRVLNAAVNYNPFTVRIDNRVFQSNLSQGEITQYGRVNQGYHTVSLTGSGGYVYLQKQVYIGDGMTTLAIINTSMGVDVIAIEDMGCATNGRTACIRVGNLAAYSGDVNVALGNLIFTSVAVGEVASFSRVNAGTYTASIARAARPGNTLLNVPLNLAAGRIYTLYVMNWNPSADAVQTLLVEDRRS